MGKEKRIAYYDISSSCAKSLKTFEGKTYILKGALAIESETGEIERVAKLYYRIRSVVNEKGAIIAKRKTIGDELVLVKKS